MNKQRIVLSSKKACRIAQKICFLFLFLFMTGSGPAEASIGGNVSFKWRANPPDDYVIGYRLYYGGSSRFYSNGAPRENFSYEYYIDFAEQKRCVARSGGTDCEMLSTDDLQCKNLYGDVPQCTVSRLHGLLYFALTAYNAQTESDFTGELYLAVNQRGMSAVQAAVSKLLLK